MAGKRPHPAVATFSHAQGRTGEGRRIQDAEQVPSPVARWEKVPKADEGLLTGPNRRTGEGRKFRRSWD